MGVVMGVVMKTRTKPQNPIKLQILISKIQINKHT